MVIVRSADLTVDSPVFQGYVLSLSDGIIGRGGNIISGGANFYQAGDESLISSGRDNTLLPLVMAGELGAFQQFGFAMAVAILLDAPVVRPVLVPATIKLLGDRDWHMHQLPNGLPEIRVEGITADAPALGFGLAGLRSTTTRNLDIRCPHIAYSIGSSPARRNIGRLPGDSTLPMGVTDA